MRIDHIAFRVADRKETVKFLAEAFGYHVQTEFTIYFNDEKTDCAQCIALEPPEKIDKNIPWKTLAWFPGTGPIDYHLPPEIFVSDGSSGSIVGDWVKARGGIGGIHHIAYQVDSVETTMKEWQEKGWADFTSEAPFHCEGLTQVFTKPHKLTGVIFEFIERQEFGFCKENVAKLMTSTKAL